MRDPESHTPQKRPQRDAVTVSGVLVRRGDRVRLRPRRRADIFDLALDGMIAVVESIEDDFDGAVHLAVVLDDDPGKDLGLLRQVGHRFFFAPEEVAPLNVAPMNHPRILIAGVGNIFLGDDGFGSEAARRLLERPWPAEVRVVDFGVRAIDLAYALSDGYETVILIDATPQGGEPGAVYLIEPDVDDPLPLETREGLWDPHRLETRELLRRVKASGSSFPRLFLVGCEPADLGGESGRLGLSPPVQAALEQAEVRIEELVGELLGRKATARRPNVSQRTP
jgi:hydrogenase maturation protease